ncbi:molecular chaperone DnaJ [Strigomonas culicis]|nr:molecular chaperone DnaJ [Strigomonas culicis]EPY18868.1 molecular chaperone DnaJ [Strigomonas culicis]|eukprot:EPY18655.1 molecular chaperone DnaJ [Strigomonas culicis]
MPCEYCGGSGRVMQRVQIMPGFVQNIAQACSHCGGRGKHIAHICPTCRGRRVAKGVTTISVDVEGGLPEGHVLVYELEGDQQPGVVPGDVRVTLLSAPHPVFTRHGDDLHMQVRLTLREALVGFEREIPHLDGHVVELAREGVTQHGQEQRLRGEGMPKHNVPSEKGDLIVTYVVEMRKTPLTAAQQAWVRENL